MRLYPAFWVCCTLTFLALLMFGRSQPTVVQYLSNMTMLSSFSLMQKIAPGSHIDGSYWSLVVEMRFYALVAVVLLLRQIHRAEYVLTGWFATVALFELTGMDHLRDVLIVDYAAYFIAGAMMYQVWSHGLSWLRAGVIVECWVLSLYESWIGRRNWIVLGALTYPLYLVHQSIGYVIFNHLYPAVDAHLLLWGTVAMMIAVAWVINVYVEQRGAGPFKWRLTRWWDAAHAFVAPVATTRDPLAPESKSQADSTV